MSVDGLVHFLLRPDQFYVREEPGSESLPADYAIPLELHCRRCGTTLCRIDAGDELTVLVNVAIDHLATRCAPASSLVDLAPVCKECQDGHHGACSGEAWIEVEFDLEERPCGCHAAAHNVLGGV